MSQITEPFPIFYDDDGTPLDDGMIYVGEENQDPRQNPIQVYYDAALTQPASQPIRTLGGRPAYQGAPTNLYVSSAQYSIEVQNRFGTPITGPVTLATGGGAVISSANVTFMQQGTGAEERTAQAKLRERVSPEDFGAIGDGNLHPLSERYTTLAEAQVDYPFATALTQQIDYCAFIAAITSQTFTSHGLYYHSGPEILLKDGAVYRMGSDTIQLKRSVHIRGAGSGMPWTSMAAMRWAAGATAFIVHRYNTIGNTVESVPTTGADGTIIEGIRILGAASTAADAYGGHAIWLRARAMMKNLYIENFRGNGYHIVATAGGSPSEEGNANNFEVHGGRVQGCENGAFIDGADTNAGSFINGDYTANRRWGIWDSSFLGNNYFNVHTDSNGDGRTVDTASAFASYSGNSYQAVPTASGANLIATTPGTNSAIWRLLASGVGGRAIAWTGSNPAGTYRSGGPVYTDNANGRCNLFGQYNESGQGNMFLSPVTIGVGGITDLPSGGAYMRAVNNNFQTESGFVSSGTNPSGKTVTAYLGGDPTNGDIFQWLHSDDNPGWTWRFRRSGADWICDNANSGARVAYTLTGQLTASQFGTGVAQPYLFNVTTLALGPGGEGRKVTYAAAAPTSGGPYAQGEIVFNNAPTAGGKVGWVCTTAGTPGTWKPFGAIDA